MNAISVALLNTLFFVYKYLQNFGLAVIVVTIVIRFVMLPLITPSLKLQQKMKEINPEIGKLKKKYAGDKQGFAKAQMDLYKQKGINPASGCLPSIVQIVFLIAFYRALSNIFPGVDKAADLGKINGMLADFIKVDPSQSLNIWFLGKDLTKPDLIHIPGLPALPGIFLLLSAAAQFLSSKISAPATKKLEEQAGATKEKSDDIATAMQGQMLYLFPLMTIFIGYTFPMGLVLYWLIFSLFNLIQQYLLLKKPAGKELLNAKN